MRSIFIIPIWAIVAFALYKIVTFVLTKRRHAALAKQLGCLPAPTFPSYLPLGLDNLRKMQKADNEGRLTDFLSERFETMTKLEGKPTHTFQINLLGQLQFLTQDPKNIQALLATQFKDYPLGRLRTGSFEPLLGNGIFSADGPHWEFSRALLRPQFAREQVSDLDLEERHLQTYMRAFKVNNDGWTDLVDLQPLNFRLTIDTASEFMFGESTNMQAAGLPDYVAPTTTKPVADKDFIHAFELSQDYISKGFRLGDMYWLAFNKEFYSKCGVAHRFIDHIIQKAIRQAELKEKNLESGEKERYFFLQGLLERTQDPKVLRDQLLSILVAGRDTTASLLSWLWLELSRHPEKFEKLRAMVIRDFGAYKSCDSGSITFSGLKSCTYLQWCLNEALRLYAIVPTNSRRSNKDTTLPRGGGPDGKSPIFVPADVEVTYTVHTMHHRRDLWGPDADEFIPERWEKRKPGWEYLPFNGGPRICIGQQFALTEAGYVTVRLLQRFDKIDDSAMAEMPNLWYLTLTGRPRFGVKVRLREAKEE